MTMKNKANLILDHSFEIDNPLHTREQIEAKFHEFTQANKISDNEFKAFGDTPRANSSRMVTVSSMGFVSPKTQRFLPISARSDQRLKSSNLRSNFKKPENLEIMSNQDTDRGVKSQKQVRKNNSPKHSNGIQWNLYDEYTLKYNLFFYSISSKT